MNRYNDINGIIFDYGGTLDSGGQHWSEVIWDAWCHAGMQRYADKELFREAYVYAERELARVRHIMPDDDFHALLLKKMRIELGWLSEHSDFPAAEIEDKSAEIARLCDDAARGRIAEARPVLERLAGRYPLVLVSNFYGNVEAVLEGYGIRGFFGDIIESAVVGVRKPDPEIYRMGVRALGMDARHVLVVGDSYTKDIVPATAAGCRAVWIKGKGWTTAEDEQQYGDIITNITELLADLP
jgi:putative hydrolase of the HAD superfamily